MNILIFESNRTELTWSRLMQSRRQPRKEETLDFLNRILFIRRVEAVRIDERGGWLAIVVLTKNVESSRKRRIEMESRNKRWKELQKNDVWLACNLQEISQNLESLISVEWTNRAHDPCRLFIHVVSNFVHAVWNTPSVRV